MPSNMTNEMMVRNITIMKYRIGEEYFFTVLDKFDEPDEVRRLGKMIEISKQLTQKNGEAYEQIWVKNSVII